MGSEQREPDKDDRERAEAYVLGRLTVHERARFKTELSRSSMLAHLVEKYERTLRVMALADLPWFRELVDQELGHVDEAMPWQSPGQSEAKDLIIRDQSGLQKINSANIMYCRSSGRCTEIYVRIDAVSNRSKRIVVSKVLKEISSMLPPHVFVRAHKQALLNVGFIMKYEHVSASHAKGGLRSARVRMLDDQWLEVSRRNRKRVQEAYEH